jgi:hypothetical protein
VCRPGLDTDFSICRPAAPGWNHHALDALGFALAGFVAWRRRRTDWVRAQTHRRDRTRNLAPMVRDLTLRAFGQRIFRSNYRPLLQPI